MVKAFKCTYVQNSKLLTFTKISLHFYGNSLMGHDKCIWPHQTGTDKLQTYQTHKDLASLQSGSLVIFCMSLLM